MSIQQLKLSIPKIRLQQVQEVMETVCLSSTYGLCDAQQNLSLLHLLLRVTALYL